MASKLLCGTFGKMTSCSTVSRMVPSPYMNQQESVQDKGEQEQEQEEAEEEKQGGARSWMLLPDNKSDQENTVSDHVITTCCEMRQVSNANEPARQRL